MKICTRDYEANAMFTVKEINGIACCPACEKPTICHNTTVEKRALFWSMSGDTGTSSESICAHMTGNPRNRFSGPPSDASDRGRCIRLLELIPEWIPRLPEMMEYDKHHQDTLVISSSGIHADHNSWQKQIPLILREGGF